MSRKNVSITKPIDERVNALIKERGFRGLSDMIATLVREEFDRRGMSLNEDATPYKANSTAELEAEAARQVKAAGERELARRRRSKSAKLK